MLPDIFDLVFVSFTKLSVYLYYSFLVWKNCYSLLYDMNDLLNFTLLQR